MTPSRPVAKLLCAVLLLDPALAGANTVRIQINVHPSGTAATPITPVALPAMQLGGANVAPLAFGTPSHVLTKDLGDVRIRGVEVAPLALPALATAPSRRLAQAGRAKPGAPAAAQPVQEAGPLALSGAAALDANALAQGISQARQQGGGGLRLRETIGSVFDGADRLRSQEIDVQAGPITQQELFGRDQGLVLNQSQAGFLAKHADDTARLRGLRATKGEAALAADDAAVLRGIDDLARSVAIGRTTPEELAWAARVASRVDAKVLAEFSKRASAFINTDVEGKSSPFARVGNVEHVEQQLIEPLAEDGKDLAWAFKTERKQSDAHFVEMLRALQYATDMGKQQVPDDMKAALMRFYPVTEAGPNWYINQFILPHEYASMVFTQQLGKRVGMTPTQILAFQKLIANHNFGPDLVDARNAKMRDHWWPKNFREQMLPMFQAMGIDVERTFAKDENGVLQYNHALGHPVSMLLAAYDRAIAVKGNGYGLATWKKYGIQDYNGKKGRLKSLRERNAKRGEGELLEIDPEGAKDEDGKAGRVFEFDGPAVIKAMYSAADWAEQHVESLWRSLYESAPAGGRLRGRYPAPAAASERPEQAGPEAKSFRMFPPFLAQRKAIGALLGILRRTEASNPAGPTNRADVLPGAGLAYYEAQSKDLAGVYRITLERTGPGAFDSRSLKYDYAARLEVYRDGGWTTPSVQGLATQGPDPVALMIDLIRRDYGW